MSIIDEYCPFERVPIDMCATQRLAGTEERKGREVCASCKWPMKRIAKMQLHENETASQPTMPNEANENLSQYGLWGSRGSRGWVTHAPCEMTANVNTLQEALEWVKKHEKECQK